MPDPLNRKPWPMKWVILAIIACIIPYTWISVAYRKPNPAFQPYEDTKHRANVIRLVRAGYQRIHIPVTPSSQGPAADNNGPAGNAEVVSAPAGLTGELNETLVEVPPLPRSFGALYAPQKTAAGKPYSFNFSAVPDEQRHSIAGGHVFIKDNRLEIVLMFERTRKASDARATEELLTMTLPEGLLKPGRYTAHLAASDESRQWEFEVR